MSINLGRFGRELSYTLNTHDPEREAIASFLHRDGVFEAFETELVLQLIQPGFTVVDAGANIGYYSCLFQLLAGDTGMVLSFEPESSNFELLKANVARLAVAGDVRLFNCALGEANGRLAVIRCDTNSGDHRVRCAVDARSDYVSVEVRSLDDVIAEIGGRAVDFLKIDTQGAELSILKGAQTTLRTNPDLVILLEFWPHGLADAGDNAIALLQLLEDCGFVFFVVRENSKTLRTVDRSELEGWAGSWLRPDGKRFVNLICVRPGSRFFGTIEALALRSCAPLARGVVHAVNSASGAAGLRLLTPYGWSFAEAWGVWSDGHDCGLQLDIESNTRTEKDGSASLHVEISLIPFVREFEPLYVQFSIGEHIFVERRFDRRKPETVRLPIPCEMLDAGEGLAVAIHIVNPKRTVGPAGDAYARLLGIGLISLAIVEGESGAGPVALRQMREPLRDSRHPVFHVEKLDLTVELIQSPINGHFVQNQPIALRIAERPGGLLEGVRLLTVDGEAIDTPVRFESRARDTEMCPGVKTHGIVVDAVPWATLSPAGIVLMVTAEGVSRPIVAVYPALTEAPFISSILYAVGQMLPRRVNFHTFVETGTLYGHTSVYAQFLFERVITIELSEELYRGVQRQFSRYQRIESLLGESSTLLKKVIGSIDESAVFFLDAHFSGNATTDWAHSRWRGYPSATAHRGEDKVLPSAQDQVPLMEELEVILERFPGWAIIIIDDWLSVGTRDFAFVGEDWTHLSHDRISSYLGAHSRVLRQWQFDLKHYVVVIEPKTGVGSK